MSDDCSRFTSRDAAYVRREFATIAEICESRRQQPEEVRELIRVGRLPAPYYVLPDGNEMVPRDYWPEEET